MEKNDNKKEELQVPVARELFLSADTSEKVPEQMMSLESDDENEKDENDEQG